ncbi:MAG: class I SAM-dependent methyltransferase [Acidobacteriaceae bacterium]|nr:class I SAM-dependent methyltransferase [Acidobacteriaceae bacterium]
MAKVCRVCGAGNLEPFLDLGDQPHCNSLLSPDHLDQAEPKYPLRVCFCPVCTTVQIDHTVAKEEMFGDYLYVSGTTETLHRHFQDTTDRLVSRLHLDPGDLVVDIGSNDGTWLGCYKPYDIDALGVEAARNLATMANQAGLHTLNCFFNEKAAESILAAHGPAKLVTAAGVFFHLEELHSATAGVARLIGPDGVFCVQAIYLGEILAHTEFDNIYHEHLTYWTVRSIGDLFARHGLEIFSAQLLPIHGGSLELLVAARGRRSIDPSVRAMLAAERAGGYHQLATYQAFADRVWQMRERLLTILADFRDRGLTVYAFGAPAKGATLLNSFGISVDMVPFAVERNPLKIGKVIPGARIPIIDEATAAPPDAYLVLPWNFLTEFLQKKRDYIMSGGKFIVPVPEPIVIDAGNFDAHVH